MGQGDPGSQHQAGLRAIVTAQYSMVCVPRIQPAPCPVRSSSALARSFRRHRTNRRMGSVLQCANSGSLPATIDGNSPVTF
jgi:hypothetical protein